MITVGSRAQIEDGGDRAEIEFAIEMREQLVIARRFPAQRIPQRVGIDRDQEEAGLPEEMLPRGLRDLRSCGKVNKAVTCIVGTAPVYALPLGLAPGRGGADFVDRAHGSGVPCLSLSLLGFSRKSPGETPTVSATAAQLKRRHGWPDA